MSDETDIEATLERLVDVMLIMEQQNQSNIHVLGSAGNIDQNIGELQDTEKVQPLLIWPTPSGS